MEMTPRLTAAYINEALKRRSLERVNQAQVAGWIHMRPQDQKWMIGKWLAEGGLGDEVKKKGLDGWKRVSSDKVRDFFGRFGKIGGH
jgi:hypothetical protein